jgi:ATP-binding protein involved in chromosome partitioning
MERARRNIAERPEQTAIPPTTKVIMIASGKGGVGKSSVTVNLAAALAAEGFTVGVMDADIWGFSVPRMLGIEGRLQGDPSEKKIRPNELAVGRGLLRVVSMGFLVDEEGSALMWRGLVLNRAVQHFLEDVAWGDLDYLLIDMPPGTGDVQMGLAKLLPRSEMIVVTTPALTAQKVAVRVVDMGRKNFLRIAGVIENMSVYVDDTGREHRIFGSGGGDRLAAEAGVPLLGRIPIEPGVSEGGDSGHPVALGDGPAAEAFRAVARTLIDEVVPPADLAGCSARLLGAVSAALDAADGLGPAGADEPSDGAPVRTP